MRRTLWEFEFPILIELSRSKFWRRTFTLTSHKFCQVSTRQFSQYQLTLIQHLTQKGANDPNDQELVLSCSMGIEFSTSVSKEKNSKNSIFFHAWQAWQQNSVSCCNDVMYYKSCYFSNIQPNECILLSIWTTILLTSVLLNFLIKIGFEN